MESVPNFNYDKLTMSFDEGLRGDIELEPPTLVNYDETIAVMDRSYLGDFITGFGLVEAQGLDIQTFSDIRDRRVFVSAGPGRSSNSVIEAYELDDGSLIGLNADHLEKAIRLCGGTGGFDPADYSLFVPTREVPFVLTSDRTPEEFIVHRLFETKEGFLEEFGATACRVCEEVHDDPFIDCPICSTRPEAVENNIELIAEEHDGVLVMLAPYIGDDLQGYVEQGHLSGRRPTEPPEPEVEVVESPGAD